MKDTAVDVITCRGSDLIPFETFIERQEKNRVGWDSGFFKVVVDQSTSRQSDKGFILEQVTKNLRKVDIQRLVQATAENIFQYKSTPARTGTIEQYKNIGLSSFSEDTCCSQELKTGTDHLVAHFFSTLLKSVQFQDSETTEAKKEHYIKKGEKLRRLYEHDLLPSTKPRSEDSEKESEKTCQCLDCMPPPRLKVCANQNDTIYYGSGVVLHKTEPILISEGFSLSTIKNILKIGDYYEGLSCPYFYMGSKHSFFPLHIEDGSLWSINYLHFGLPKIWIMIPPRAILLLNYHLWKSGLALGNTSCYNILGHKTVFPTTQWLEERLIPFEVVVQNPGEAVVLYPNTAHYGWNIGWNMAEAINFGTKSWIVEGINAPKCKCMSAQIHLDMPLFVGTFMPELLDKVLTRQYIETPRNLSSITFFNQEIKKITEVEKSMPRTKLDQKSSKRDSKGNVKNKTKLECPAPFCEKQFSKYSSLFSHVMNDHRPIIQKCDLMQKLNKLAQES